MLDRIGRCSTLQAALLVVVVVWLLLLLLMCIWCSVSVVFPQVSIRVGGEEVVEGTTAQLRGVWEATSYQLERLQCNPACVEQEVSESGDVF